MIEELKKKYPVIYECPVAWGEMDALGHVNNIIYFRYFESARSEYFQAMGLWDSAKASGIGVILHSTSCRFRKPLTYPDRVSVGARVTNIGKDRFRMEYAVYSHGMNSVAAEGEGLIVVYDYRRGTKCAMPDNLRDAIRRIERSEVSIEAT